MPKNFQHPGSEGPKLDLSGLTTNRSKTYWPSFIEECLYSSIDIEY